MPAFRTMHIIVASLAMIFEKLFAAFKILRFCRRQK